MANGHGGYRKPSNPASVSGPGAHSRRTDGRPQAVADLPDAGYGENADFREIQSGAPISGGGPSPTTPGGGSPAAMPTPLHAPSERPDEPVTAGAALGDGAGLDALNLPSAEDGAAKLKKYGPMLPVWIRVAEGPQGSQELKDLIRAVIAAQ